MSLAQALLITDDQALPRTALPPRRTNLDTIESEAERCLAAGVTTLLLLAAPQQRSANGQQAADPGGLLPQAIRRVKRSFPQLTVVSDVCCCQHNASGHCGIIRDGVIREDESLTLFQEIARTHIAAGVDIVMPSSTLDGVVRAVREVCTPPGTQIWGQGSKGASSLYSLFRTASHSAPQGGGKESYQPGIGQRTELLRELVDDQTQGADALIIKPAVTSGDLIVATRRRSQLPLVAFLTSGEHALALAADPESNGLVPLRQWVRALARAGASAVVSYQAVDILSQLSMSESVETPATTKFSEFTVPGQLG